MPMLHPELRIAPPYTEWTFSGDMVRMPEFCAPALGNKPNIVSHRCRIPRRRQWRALQARREFGGLTCFVEDGILCYEYNLFIIQRTKIRGHGKAAGRQGQDRNRDALCRAQAGRAAESNHEGWPAR